MYVAELIKSLSRDREFKLSEQSCVDRLEDNGFDAQVQTSTLGQLEKPVLRVLGRPQQALRGLNRSMLAKHVRKVMRVVMASTPRLPEGSFELPQKLAFQVRVLGFVKRGVGH